MKNWKLVLFPVYAFVLLAVGLHFNASSALRTSTPPLGVPILLWWVEDNGTLNATSAIRTDFAGYIQFSLDGHPVPADELYDWDYWSPIKQSLIERSDYQ